MPAFLSLRTGKHTERVEIKDIVTIGRDKSNSLPIRDPEISRTHSMIRCLAQDQYYLFDTGSRNGSFINGIRISAPSLLKSGDIITVGNTSLVFQQFSIPATSYKPETTFLTETIQSDVSSIQTISVLVADIRGYTSLSEYLSIKTLSDVMSAWFDDVQKIVERNRGRVDKFIGDCVMAIWEIGDRPQRDILPVIQAAHEIYRYTGALHKKFKDIGTPLRIGVGINTGEAAIGIGADHTAMGDTVNLAFRLESETKKLNVDMVLSQSSYKLLPRKLWGGREVTVTVKGKKDPVQICTFQLTDKSSILQN